MTTALLVVGILVFLIVVHELGHFFAAKMFKVRVEEFGVGYPPKAFTFGKWGGTEYTLNWIPFGGFVRLFGEGGETRAHGSFAGAPKYAQALILVAGVAMNALAAWFLFAGALASGIPHALSPDESAENAHLVISAVVAGSPAESAGLGMGDEITSLVDSTGKVAELTPTGVASFIAERGGKTLDVTFMRGGEEKAAVVRPAHAVIESDAGRPALGVGLALVSDEPIPFFSALWYALPLTFDRLHAIIASLSQMVSNGISGAPVLRDIVGPVGLVGVVGDAAQHGFANILMLAGFISLNLAVVNLLPIPALDGGRLVLLGIEVLMRRPASRRIVGVFNAAGVGLIILLMISVTYNDIARLLS